MKIPSRLIDGALGSGGSRLTVIAVANAPFSIIHTVGDTYIVGDSPTDEFTGTTPGHLATFTGSAWTFSAPSGEVIDINSGQILRYENAVWSAVATLELWSGDRMLTGIEVYDGEQNVATMGDVLSYDNVRVIARYLNGVGIDVTENCVFVPIAGTTIESVGEQEISVSYTDGGRTA